MPSRSYDVKPAATQPGESTVLEWREKVGSQAGQIHTVAVAAYDAFGNPRETGNDSISVAAVHQNGLVVHADIKDKLNGQYDVTFNATVAGEYNLNVRIGDNSIKGGPFAFEVLPGEVSALQTAPLDTTWTKLKAGDSSQILFRARDRFLNPVETSQLRLKSTISHTTIAELDKTTESSLDKGIYTLQAQPTVSGVYKLEVAVGNVPLAGSPYEMVVTHAAAAASRCTSEGQHLAHGTVGDETSFFIYPKDAFDNNVTDGSVDFSAVLNGPSNPPVSLQTLPSGVIAAEYTVTASGLYQLEVSLRGAPIRGSPFTISIKAASADAKQTEVSGDRQRQHEVGITARFSLQLRDRFGNSVESHDDVIDVTMGGPNNITVEPSIEDRHDGTIEASRYNAVSFPFRA